MRRRTRRTYGLVAVLLFALLLLIETQLDGGFIRNTAGDFLVVILLYALLMALSRSRPLTGALTSLGIAYLIEISQSLNLIDRLGLQRSWLTDAVLGSTFTWRDMVAYTTGIATIIVVETFRPTNQI